MNAIGSKFANATNSVVLGVDYRLAPEHLFPAQFQDSCSVVSIVIKEPTKFGIIVGKIVLGRGSAGRFLLTFIVHSDCSRLPSLSTPRQDSGRVKANFYCDCGVSCFGKRRKPFCILSTGRWCFCSPQNLQNAPCIPWKCSHFSYISYLDSVFYGNWL